MVVFKHGFFGPLPIKRRGPCPLSLNLGGYDYLSQRGTAEVMQCDFRGCAASAFSATTLNAGHSEPPCCGEAHAIAVATLRCLVSSPRDARPPSHHRHHTGRRRSLWMIPAPSHSELPADTPHITKQLSQWALPSNKVDGLHPYVSEWFVVTTDARLPKSPACMLCTI